MYNSERILACRSLIMEDVNFWEEDLKPDNPCDNVKQLMQKVDRLQIAIQESSLDDDSRDVATTIAGYIQSFSGVQFISTSNLSILRGLCDIWP